MDRREFLKRGALVAAGAAVSGSVLSGLVGASGCAPRQEKRIGLQLYSLREAMGSDPLGTLKLVAAMGYKELETASYNDGKIYGYEPEEFRTICENLGMKVSSCHLGKNIDPENMEAVYEWWKKAMDAQAAVGCKYVIMPSYPIGETLEEVKAYCDYFNTLGKMASEKGMKFGFHNHNREFKTIGDVVVYDYMLANTSADLVLFEMDVYWVKEGGADPVEYLKKYAGRFPVLHIKDNAIIGDSGHIDFKEIFDAAYAQGMEDYYVEVEKYTLPPFNCVEKSYDFLYAADYVK